MQRNSYRELLLKNFFYLEKVIDEFLTVAEAAVKDVNGVVLYF